MTKKLVSVEAKPTKDRLAVINLTFKIQNLNHLYSIVDKVKTIPDVYSVKRTKG